MMVRSQTLPSTDKCKLYLKSQVGNRFGVYPVLRFRPRLIPEEPHFGVVHLARPDHRSLDSR